MTLKQLDDILSNCMAFNKALIITDGNYNLVIIDKKGNDYILKTLDPFCIYDEVIEEQEMRTMIDRFSIKEIVSLSSLDYSSILKEIL